VQPLNYYGPGWPFASSDIEENLAQPVGTADKQINLPSLSADIKKNLSKLAGVVNQQIDPLFFCAVVNQTIASIPKSFPKTGDTFQIPVESTDGQRWTSHEYTVEEIPLGSPKLNGNFFFDFVRERIVMCAYGLTSAEPETAPPLLIMPATTFPGQRGCLQSAMSAFTPFGNVGEFAYWSGKENINNWLEKQENVRGYGISQGGALLELALHEYSWKFAQANILSAPGLVNGCFSEVGQKAVEMRIYVQMTDPVSKVGYFPEGSPEKNNVHLYHLSQENDYASFSWWADLFLGWIAHFQHCLTTRKNISIISSKNIEAYNNSRERDFRTTVHKVISVVIFFLVPLIVLICEIGLLFSAGCSKLGELTRDSWHQLKRNEKLKSLSISVKNAVDAIVIRRNSPSTSQIT
jgi:hypothetical protein